MADRSPNIVLINCDDLGYGDLGCYGSERNDSPVLDRLATEGTQFTDFVMASPVCSPSRAAMLTGCYPPRIGFGDFDGFPVLFPGHRMGLHPEEVTIASLLRDAGYATAMVGKWHCGDQPEFLPTRHGFDRYFGLPYSNDMGRQAMPEGLPRFEELMEQLDMPLPCAEMPPLPLLDDEEVLEQQPDQAALTVRYLQECLRFMRGNCDRPFFLYLAHMYVHVPIYVEQRFADESRNGAYGAAVACVDWTTGVLLAELRRLGLEDDTLVVFTSDNGSRGVDGGSNAPLRGAKGTTWEGGMRVPMIARWPGRVPAGRVVSAPVMSLDLYPTFAALAGTELPPDRRIDGRDLCSLLLGASSGSPHDATCYYRGDDLEAVRAGRWKLHVARGGGPVEELYDLEADPAESVDRFAEQPGVVAELLIHVDAARADLGDRRLGIEGSGRRPVGVVERPRTLTTFDPAHPYYLAEYDLPDRG
jgi:arylsulfatase A-like enzyme